MTAKYLNGSLTDVAVQANANPCVLDVVALANPNAALTYLALFDTANAAGIVPGTTVPDFFFTAPSSGALNLSALELPFLNGCALLVTTTSPLSAVAPGSNLFGAFLFS